MDLGGVLPGALPEVVPQAVLPQDVLGEDDPVERFHREAQRTWVSLEQMKADVFPLDTSMTGLEAAADRLEAGMALLVRRRFDFSEIMTHLRVQDMSQRRSILAKLDGAFAALRRAARVLNVRLTRCCFPCDLAVAEMCVAEGVLLYRSYANAVRTDIWEPYLQARLRPGAEPPTLYGRPAARFLRQYVQALRPSLQCVIDDGDYGSEPGSDGPELADDTCFVCMDRKSSGRAQCGHALCYFCWSNILLSGNSSCPMCKQQPQRITRF